MNFKTPILALLLGLLAAAAPVPAGAENVTYLHTDNLGSPVLETDQNGNVLRWVEYSAYGEELGAAPADGPAFTSHYRDAGTGLVYMQQRYYDPQVGRFLSVDPVTALDNGDMRHLNRYVYAYNSPYKFTDPDGRAPPGCGDGTCESYDRRMQELAGVLAGAATTFPDIANAISPDGGGFGTALTTLLFSSETKEVAATAPATTRAAAARAKELHSVLDPRAQRARTTAVTETREGVRVVSSSERRLAPAQRAQLGVDEVEGVGVGHAEVTGINAARSMGLTPTGTAASRPICTSCAGTLLEEEIVPLSPLR